MYLCGPINTPQSIRLYRCIPFMYIIMLTFFNYGEGDLYYKTVLSFSKEMYATLR